MRLTLGEIAKMTGAALEGDPDHVITSASGIVEATGTDIAFLDNRKYGSLVAKSAAGAIFLPPDTRDLVGGPKNRLYTESPKWAHAHIIKIIYEEKWPIEAVEISKNADIHHEVVMGKGVSVGPFTVIKRRTMIGENTRISAQCFIGYNVRIGKNCVLHPQVVVNDLCQLEDNVIVHPGTIIGGEGYAYDTDRKTGVHRKVHQVGRVILENDVEVGSNVTIDRAATGETRVGAGTKIDNLVQIAHNVTLGRNCLVISQVGIAGSTHIGNQVTLAGQAGIVGHLSIGDGAIITAQTGVMGDVKPGEILFGSPARPHREAMKLQALLSKLPEMHKFIKSAKELLRRETSDEKR